jgi:hypothetical protein
MVFLRGEKVACGEGRKKGKLMIRGDGKQGDGESKEGRIRRRKSSPKSEREGQGAEMRKERDQQQNLGRRRSKVRPSDGRAHPGCPHRMRLYTQWNAGRCCTTSKGKAQRDRACSSRHQAYMACAHSILKRADSTSGLPGSFDRCSRR